MPDLQRGAGLSIHYHIDDFTDPWVESPMLLLQHGNGRSGHFWYRWVPLLAGHFKVVRPDMRGLGRSTRPADLERSLTLDSLVGDLVGCSIIWMSSACTIVASRWAASLDLPFRRCTPIGSAA